MNWDSDAHDTETVLSSKKKKKRSNAKMFSSHYRISDELISQPSWCVLGSDAISWAASCKYGGTYRPVLEETDHKKIT